MSDTRLTYHHGNLRRELVNAAVELLRSEGGEELTLRAVARAAGVSQTAPYRHFSDKGALLAAVAETGFAKLDERCQQAMSNSGRPRDRLHQLGNAYVQFALDEPALYRLMFGAELGPFKDEYPSLAAGAKQVHDMMRITVEDLMSEGRATDAEIESACTAAWSLVHGLASLLIDRSIKVPPSKTSALIDSVTRQFAEGLYSGESCCNPELAPRNSERGELEGLNNMSTSELLERTAGHGGAPMKPSGTLHIGIVGCSAEGAALCYRTICTEGAEFLGPHAHPEVSTHTPSLAKYVNCLERGDLVGIGELMLESANKLARMGADFVICPDNTIHQAYPYVQPRSPLPWLHIAEVVAAEASDRGYRRLGLTGTHWLVSSDVYPDALAARGIQCITPDAVERDEISRLIMDELVCGVAKPAGVIYLQSVIERFKDQGCEAVILGCTELPLIIHERNSPLPTLDSTRLLARAALRRAMA